MDLSSLTDKLFSFDKLLKKNQQDFTAINLGNLYLKGLTIKNNQICDYFQVRNDDLAQSLSKIWQEKAITSKNVRISLKDLFCLVRNFSFPKVDKRKLRQALFYEMKKFIPFSPQEVYFDFFILKDLGPKEIFVLLAVAKKELIDSKLAVFEKLNLKVSQICLDSICLNNLFLNNYPDSSKNNVCLLDIGYSFSTINILNQGIPFLIRDVKFASKEIFEIVSRMKNIEITKVNEWLLSLKDAKEFLDLARGNILNVCKEIKNSFDYFEENRASGIDKVYLSGGLAAIPGIAAIFSENLETETVALEVLPKSKRVLSQAFSSDEFSGLKSGFAASFGLSL